MITLAVASMMMADAHSFGRESKYFKTGHLIQALVNVDTGKQIILDVSADRFGTVEDLLNGLNTETFTLIYDAPYYRRAVNLSDVDEFLGRVDFRLEETGAKGWSRFRLGYFASLDTNRGYFAARPPALESIRPTSKGSFQGSATVVQGYARATTNKNFAVSDVWQTAGYDVKMNPARGTPGDYGHLDPTVGEERVGEVLGLEELDGPAGSLIDMFLYGIDGWNKGPVARLRLVKQEDGSVDLFGLRLKQVPHVE